MWQLWVWVLGLALSPVGQNADFTERTYELFVPDSYDESQPAPLLLVLHGASGTGASTQGWLGFDAFAETAGFIVVYPDGIENNWDFGAGISTDNGQITVDDVGFLVWLVEEIGKAYRIDSERVYAAGMSNGALMAYRLACTAPDTFAAVAGVAAPLYLPAARDCDDTPVSVLFIHGTDDPILPWEQLRLRSGQVIALSAFESFAFWLQRNQCSSDPAAIESEALPDIARDDDSQVGHLAVRNCANGTEVHFYGIQGGGHTWPSRLFEIDLALGALNRDIDASEVIINWLVGLPVRGSTDEATPEPEA